jgi:cohesin loading factor subunit SCC2
VDRFYLLQVTDSDQQLMIYSFMKKAVTQRFSDEAISVREAAVSLVGAYVVRSPTVANSFHAAFMIGLSDSGVSVRKRTIKILEDILCSNPNYKGRAEACSEMLRLAADPKEDDGVRDLIHAVFMKVWLDKGDQSVPQPSSVSPSPTEPKTPTSGYVQGLEERPLTTGGKTAASGATAATPASPVVGEILSPLMTRETRSSERKTNKRRLQIRSEIAAEQMVEVVKAANTGEHLTTLFRELLDAAHDAETSRKSSQRKKQKLIAQDHCSMLVDALLEILLSFEENRSAITAPGNELVAIMRTIKVFTDVSVDSVVKHLDTLLPYMKADNGLSIEEEAVIVSSLSDIISRLAGVFDQQDVERLGDSSLADDLVNVTYKLGRNALSSAAQALCALAHHRHSNPDIPFRKKLLKLANVFYRVLCKHQDAADFSTQRLKVKANVHRSISVLGSICQYHQTALQDVDTDEDDGESFMKPITWENLTFQCRGIFMKYLAKNDNQTKCVALRAMCGVFIAHPRELLRMNQSGMISEVMALESPPSLQLEALLCWREILLVRLKSVLLERGTVSMTNSLLFCFIVRLYRPKKPGSKVARRRPKWIRKRILHSPKGYLETKMATRLFLAPF